ncbi:MAG: hypothetical protein BWY82_01247 [Verrucomicrobia bacterium ADurb.Bin474]|nr:MAG: hypothetical protein BWY82_01247 [Verrucomicrobia bacterium ADurb.Bin474]
MDPDLTEFGDALLTGLGLEFAGGLDVGQERDMDEKHVFLADFQRELSHGFEEGKPFDVADSSANFRDEDVNVVAGIGQTGLDLVGHMRDNLNGAAQVVAAALGLDDREIDLAGGDAGRAGTGDVHEALIVAEVEVGFGAIIQHIDFAVLEWIHGARIHVQVRIKLLDLDTLAPLFEESTQSRSSQPFSQGGNHSTGYEYVFHQL